MYELYNFNSVYIYTMYFYIKKIVKFSCFKASMAVNYPYREKKWVVTQHLLFLNISSQLGQNHVDMNYTQFLKHPSIVESLSATPTPLLRSLPSILPHPR